MKNSCRVCCTSKTICGTLLIRLIAQFQRVVQSSFQANNLVIFIPSMHRYKFIEATHMNALLNYSIASDMYQNDVIKLVSNDLAICYSTPFNSLEPYSAYVCMHARTHTYSTHCIDYKLFIRKTDCSWLCTDTADRTLATAMSMQFIINLNHTVIHCSDYNCSHRKHGW